jgi:ParB-like chromosome segregation protein Spo0J
MKITTYAFKELVLKGFGFTNPRTTVDNRSIAELADSIERDGLKTPLRVWTPVDDNGLHIVVAGSRRMAAIEKLIKERRDGGLKLAIPCVDVAPEALVGKKLDNREDRILIVAKADALVDNLQRKDLTSYELAVEMTALRELGVSGKEMAKMLSKSQAWVSRHLSSLEAASPALADAWKAAKLPDDDVQNLAKLKVEDEKGKMVPDHEAQDKRLDKLLKHRAAAAANPKQSKTELAKAREVAKGTPTGKPPAPARPGVELINNFIAALDKVPKGERYLQGLRDGLRFATGELGPGEFDKEFSSYVTKDGVASDAAPPKPAAKAAPKVAPTPTAKTATLGTVGKEKATKGTPYKGAKGYWWVDYSNGMKFAYPSRSKARKSKAADGIGENNRVA